MGDPDLYARAEEGASYSFIPVPMLMMQKEF